MTTYEEVLQRVESERDKLRARVAELERGANSDTSRSAGMASRGASATELAAERAAHLATRQELSMALTERAHARAEAEMHKGLRAETLKANENLRAEVERLTKELTDLKGDDDAWRRTYESTHAELLEVHAEVERLREALRSYGAHAPDCGDAHDCTCGYSAALAGSPVETRLPVDDEAEARFEKLLAKRREKAESWLNQGPEVSGTLAFHTEPVETRRALAERVREACIEALAESDGDPRSLHDLDLDALLEER